MSAYLSSGWLGTLTANSVQNIYDGGVELSPHLQVIGIRALDLQVNPIQYR